MVKRNNLGSFSSFYLPKLTMDEANRNKRNVLDSFTSFYLPKDAARNKRNAEDSEAESETGLDKKNGLDTFTSFYLPKLQVPISPTFYERLFCQNPFAKKLQTQIVST